MPHPSKSSRIEREVAPRAKLWLEIDGRYIFGHGISDILKAVEATGSIKAAARRTGKSYRHVWAKIKQTEQALGVPLVCTQVGGKDARRSQLSEVARHLVREFDAMRQRVFELVDREFGQSLGPELRRHGRTARRRKSADQTAAE